MLEQHPLWSKLVCPETKLPVTLAESRLLEQINTRITEGTLMNRSGKPVRSPLEGGLLREDQQYLYPIRKNVPVMLVEEAIPLEQLSRKP